MTLDDNRVALALYGERNANLKLVERETGTEVHARGNELTFVGAADAVSVARRLVEQLYGMARGGTPISPEDIGRAAVALRADAGVDLRDVFNDTILVAGRARPIAPKGLAQKRYVDAIRSHDLVFGVGPAGTGKTYLAMALAHPRAAREAGASASSSRGPPSRPASASASCPAAWRRRSRPTCGLSTTRSTT